ncbi:MAG TPA: 1,4-dihydroxy-6-naphthoate synthase [Chitinophagaceae bacterium]|nr:1,4-dihydroxy-6-naphthoate synthase [Chitinophagaceae bacterium]
MKCTLGFSPCPNDTFIFDALVNKKIDTEGFDFEVILEDVETLNQWALEGKLDITKLSFPAFFQSLEKYVLLNSGSALGKGVGPLLISKLKIESHGPGIENAVIALPGINTTANLLFSFAYPGATNKKFIVFSGIENAVLGGEADLGVIIHENRFTYQQRGLNKVMDLGEYWEEKMKVPIPLGTIAVRRKFGQIDSEKISGLIKKSLEHAFHNYPLVTDYVKTHSQEMSEDVMLQHVDLYVNNYSLDLGRDGKEAIGILHEVFQKMNPGKSSKESLFL